MTTTLHLRRESDCPPPSGLYYLKGQLGGSMLWSYAGIYCSISPTENLEWNVRSRKNVTQCDHSCRTGCILDRVSLLIRQFPPYGLREFSRTRIVWLSGTALAARVFRGPAVLRLNHLVFAKFPCRLLQGRLVHLVEENTAPSRQLGPWRERGE